MSYKKKFLSQFGTFKEGEYTEEKKVNDLEDEILPGDILDLSQINFDNDETWLHQSSECIKLKLSASRFIKRQTELSPEKYLGDFSKNLHSKETNLKNINTQTFTRPKKTLRPSIEKYNQELFGYTSDVMNRSSSPESPRFLERAVLKDSGLGNPLEFDLSQSVNSHYLRRIAGNTDSEDSFQNMSPPSLVNSMCSSTFTNLMESSFIKNDPVLKQICDMDFTTSILSQGSEPSSLIQSLNFSTNSVDDFMTKFSQDDVMKSMEMNGGEMKCSGDSSFIVHRKNCYTKEDNRIPDSEEFQDPNEMNILERQNQNVHNGTYRKSNRLSSATFRKTDFNRSAMGRNHTYEIDLKDVEQAQNETVSINSPVSSKPLIINAQNETLKKSSSVENFKNNTVLKDSCNNDLNRYGSKENDLVDECLSSHNHKKSLDCSIGSADSLDRMSTLSSSSKGSNKMLNMEEVEAIAEKQEKSLQQVVSTPKPNVINKVFNRFIWDHGFISPVVANEIQSDSGDSSDEYKSVKSTFSKTSLENNPIKQTRSLASLQDPSNLRKLKSINTMVRQENVHKASPAGSVGNLQKLDGPILGLPQNRIGSAGSINVKSNLNTMKPTLKGSYTSLKPVNSHLPVAPPINAPSSALNSTWVTPANSCPQIPNSRNIRNQGPEKISVKPSTDGGFLKPSGPLRSGLPRPTSSTSIPRPVSKIPGPKRFSVQKQHP